MTYKLFLDDLRNPRDVYPTTSNSEWVIARNFSEFVKTIESKGLPFLISFDHDLSHEHYLPGPPSCYKEKTGMDCAKWLVEYCMDKNLDLPKCNIHSANPVGAENIVSYLRSYEKSKKIP